MLGAIQGHDKTRYYGFFPEIVAIEWGARPLLWNMNGYGTMFSMFFSFFPNSLDWTDWWPWPGTERRTLISKRQVLGQSMAAPGCGTVAPCY